MAKPQTVDDRGVAPWHRGFQESPGPVGGRVWLALHGPLLFLAAGPEPWAPILDKIHREMGEISGTNIRYYKHYCNVLQCLAMICNYHIL